MIPPPGLAANGGWTSSLTLSNGSCTLKYRDDSTSCPPKLDAYQVRTVGELIDLVVGL